MRSTLHTSIIILTSVAALTLSACQKSSQPDENEIVEESAVKPEQGSAIATLASADGAPHGTANLTVIPGGLKLELKADNLADGMHGIHLHMTGKCEGPKFETAGGHWNPGNRKHGLESPDGAHAGDMTNISSAGQPVTNYSFELKGASLSEGDHPVLDADGTAIIIHAKPDDNKTDPSGDSGDRLICGVFKRA